MRFVCRCFRLGILGAMTIRSIAMDGNGYESVNNLVAFIPDYHREVIQCVNFVLLCGVVSLFGIATNVINLVIFYKQGLDSTTNISFFALAVSDLCGLLLQQLFSFFLNPLSQHLHLPIKYTDVQHLTSGVPRAVFSRITCLITVYLTAERCLCVAFPLHVKQIITPRRTSIVIAIIYSLTLLSAVPFYTANYLDWVFDCQWNKSLLVIVTSSDQIVGNAVLFVIMALSGVVSFILVVVFTAILLTNLREKSSWRKTANAQQNTHESASIRDRKTMVMVVLVAGILIICYIPSTSLALATVCEPEFSVGGRYYNLYYFLWSFAFLFETINSSVNIFLYLKMSSKYRQAFHELFSCRRQNASY